MKTTDPHTATGEADRQAARCPRVLRLGAVGATGVALAAAGELGAPYLAAEKGLLSHRWRVRRDVHRARRPPFYMEIFPTSPLILYPFKDPLPIPKALAPVPCRGRRWSDPPGPGIGQQTNAAQRAPPDLDQRHRVPRTRSSTRSSAGQHPLVHVVAGAADQLARAADESVRRSRQDVPGGHGADAAAEHDLRVQRHVPGADDQCRVRPAGAGALREPPRREPLNLDRQDFGSPDCSFLTHLHNAHTAPESDGNPHYSMIVRPAHEGTSPGCGSTTSI